MSKVSAASQLKQQLAKLTGTEADDWFLVTKARFGLEVILKVLAEQRGTGEIITQPFTCLTAVNPILVTGHIPVYAETSPQTLSIDTNDLQASEETRALIAQHTFGIPADMTVCREFADKNNLLLIEDSAHKISLLAKANKKPLADVSVHSFGVEKMLPTKFGAAVWINPELTDSVMQNALRAAFENLPKLKKFANYRAKNYVTTNRVLSHIPAFLGARAARSILARLGLFEAPIMPVERKGKNFGVPSQPAKWMIRQATNALKQYDESHRRRKSIGRVYFSALANHPTLQIPGDVQLEDAMTRFPLICSSAEEAETLFARLASKGLNPGKWYRPTLFPGPTNPAVYNYDPEDCPVAESLSARILNLPTNVSEERAKEILDAIER